MIHASNRRIQQGTGEYLEYTCLKCHRRSRKQPNYIEGGTARTYSKTPSCGNQEDK